MAEVEFLRQRLEAEKRLTTEARSLIEILEQRIALLQKAIDSYKVALATSDKIETVDSRLIQSYEQSLKDAKAEIAKQTAKANFWRRFAGLGVTAALTIGLIVGFVVGNK